MKRLILEGAVVMARCGWCRAGVGGWCVGFVGFRKGEVLARGV